MSDAPSSEPDRALIAAFVDGFNLYHGLHDLSGRKDLWLDVEGMLKRYVRPGEELSEIHYFTAQVHGAGQPRQAEFLRALRAHCPALETHVGRFQTKTMRCRACGATWTSYEEKESDAALAARLVAAAASRTFRQLWVVSGDADMRPGVRIAKALQPDLEIVVVRPPRRLSAHLEREADRVLSIRDRDPRRHQMPDRVNCPDGPAVRPSHWT